jgi:HEAT repeat protein
MEQINTELKNLIESGDIDKLENFLFTLDVDKINTKLISDLCSAIQIENKGIRNLIMQFFLSNRFEKLPFCVVNYISSKDITLRNLTGELLIQYDNYSIDALINFINNSTNDFDIKFAADILALIVDEKVVSFLIDLMNKTNNDNIIISCIEGFGNNRSTETIQQLKELYHKKDIFKPYVIESMGKIGSEEAFKFITECYNDPDMLVKYNVLESLGNIGNEDSFFFLISELQNADESFIQPILESIYKLQKKYGFDLPYDEKIKRAVLLLLNQQDIEYIRIAIKFLSPYNEPELIYEMLLHYGKDEEVDWIIYEKVMQNISEFLVIIPNILISNPKNLADLLALLNKIFEGDSESIIETNKFLVHKIIDAVSRCLTHPEEMVRLHSVELLFKLDVETALILLDEEFLNANFWIKLRMIEILEAINKPVGINFLIKLSEDEKK